MLFLGKWTREPENIQRCRSNFVLGVCLILLINEVQKIDSSMTCEFGKRDLVAYTTSF